MIRSSLEFAVWDHMGTSGNTELSSAPTCELYDRRLREIELLERYGFKYFFGVEHQNTTYSLTPSPDLFLAAASQRTSSIRLGALVWTLPFHNPIRLAQQLAMLDHLSRGRVEAGFGIGVHEHEFIRWNLPFNERGPMFAEAFEIIKRAWTEDTVSYDGKYWKLNEAIPLPKPYQKPHPPVWWAGHSYSSIEWAAKNNLQLALNIDVDDVIKQKFGFYRKVWRDCNHRSGAPKLALVRHVYVAASDERAEKECRESLLNYIPSIFNAVKWTKLGFLGNQRETPTNLEKRRVFDEQTKSFQFWIDNGLAIVGSPKTCIERIRSRSNEMGYDIFGATFEVGELNEEQVTNSIRLFGDEVMPGLIKR